MNKSESNFLFLKKITREGKGYIYDEVWGKKKILLFLKLAFMLLRYARLKEEHQILEKNVIFIKGNNQARLYAFYKDKITDMIGDHKCFYFEREAELNIIDILKSLPQLLKPAFYALMALFSKKNKRWLNLIIIQIYNMIQEVADKTFSSVDCFVCFNDQPLDVSALINIFNTKDGCETIVIQHGLILSPDFYFPINAKKFMAWGENVLSIANKRDKEKILIAGRYSNDSDNKVELFSFNKKNRIKILIAPSYFHSEIFSIVTKIKTILTDHNINAEVVIKLHPATKLTALLKLRLCFYWRQLNLTNDHMEDLSCKFDCLFTKNSTSAVDFLLRGKPVYFSCVNRNSYPDVKYAFNYDDFISHYSCEQKCIESDIAFKNLGRLEFIKGEINV